MRTFILFLFERCIAQWWHDNHVVFLTQINGGGWVGGRESTAAVPWWDTCTLRPSRPLILGTYFHMATFEGLRSASPMPWATLFHRIFLGMWSWNKSERQRQGGGAVSLEAQCMWHQIQKLFLEVGRLWVDLSSHLPHWKWEFALEKRGDKHAALPFWI